MMLSKVLLILKLSFIITNISMVKAVNIRFITLVIGGAGVGRHHMGYQIAGAAYDTALEHSRNLYPRVFQNFSLTRHFVPGLLSCQDAAAEAVTSLASLYSNQHYLSVNSSSSTASTTGEREFMVMFAPACGAEGIVMGDFAREIDVNVFLSSSSLSLHNDKRRFPTTFPWYSNGYDPIIWSMFELMKLYKWTKFTFVCDDNKKDALTFVFDSFCVSVQQTFRLKVMRSGDINMLVVKYDSSKNETIRPMLEKCVNYSSIIALASSPAAYKAVLEIASSMGMSTGDYVFVLTPLTVFVQFEELLWTSDQVSSEIREMLPYCLTISFVSVNWTAMEGMVEQMVQRSSSEYNWTILPQYRHNLGPLAAYEALRIVCQVLNENYDDLERFSGRDFAKRFWNRSFSLPSRVVETTQVGYRVAHTWIRQFDPEASDFFPVLKYDALSGQIGRCTGCCNVTWPRGTFPPPVTPICGHHHELCQEKDRWRSILIGGLVAVTSLILVMVISCSRYLMALKKEAAGIGPWWLLDGTFRTAAICWKQLNPFISDQVYATLFRSTRSLALSG